MGLDQIPTAFAAQYANWLAGLLFILLLLLVIRSRSNRFRKAWRPLIPVVRGRLKKQRAKATMTGSYHGRTVTANACNEAGGTETFTVEMPVESGGRDWEISRRSEKLLGPEAWRPSTRDPALQAQLEGANVSAWLRDWPAHTIIRYDAERGVLALCEEASTPSAQHFKSQLELLESLADVNRQINSD